MKEVSKISKNTQLQYACGKRISLTVYTDYVIFIAIVNEIKHTIRKYMQFGYLHLEELFLFLLI